MTEQEARIALLECLLDQSRSTIEFMHMCLISPDDHQYMYPDHTFKHLKEIEELIGPHPEGCYHSLTQADCKGCQAGHEWRTKYYTAREVLGLKKK